MLKIIIKHTTVSTLTSGLLACSFLQSALGNHSRVKCMVASERRTHGTPHPTTSIRKKKRMHKLLRQVGSARGASRATSKTNGAPIAPRRRMHNIKSLKPKTLPPNKERKEKNPAETQFDFVLIQSHSRCNQHPTGTQF